MSKNHWKHDLSGQRFHRLLVIKQVGVHPSSRRVLWQCRCDCGELLNVQSSLLLNANTKSCGCLQREKASARCSEINPKHGLAVRGHRAPIYEAWLGMIQRCTNPNVSQWKRYGARGVKICKRWRDSFENFLSDMGQRPSPKHSLDRWPNRDGNYEPGNCRWATAKEQAQNRDNSRMVKNFKNDQRRRSTNASRAARPFES